MTAQQVTRSRSQTTPGSATPRLYIFIIQQIYQQLGQDSDDGRYLGPKALCLDCCVKIFFFMTVWQVRRFRLARDGLFIQPEHQPGMGGTVERFVQPVMGQEISFRSKIKRKPAWFGTGPAIILRGPFWSILYIII